MGGGLELSRPYGAEEELGSSGIRSPASSGHWSNVPCLTSRQKTAGEVAGGIVFLAC